MIKMNKDVNGSQRTKRSLQSVKETIVVLASLAVLLVKYVALLAVHKPEEVID